MCEKSGLEENDNNSSLLVRKKSPDSSQNINILLFHLLENPVNKNILFQGDSFMLKEGQHRAACDIFFKFME